MIILLQGECPGFGSFPRNSFPAAHSKRDAFSIQKKYTPLRVSTNRPFRRGEAKRHEFSYSPFSGDKQDYMPSPAEEFLSGQKTGLCGDLHIVIPSCHPDYLIAV